MALRFTRHRAAKRQEHRAEEKRCNRCGCGGSKADEAETDRFVSLYDPAVLHFDGTYGWLAAAIVAAGSKKSYDFAFTQFLLVLPVLIAGGHYFKNGLKNLWHRSPNMDSLIALGSGAAFVYGIYAIYKIAWGFSIEDMDMVETFGMNLYFESSAMILTLITLGKFMEARAKSKTSEAITKLMDLAPKTAKVLRNGQEEEISVDDVQNGDILVVRDGDTVPVDGKLQKALLLWMNLRLPAKAFRWTSRPEIL